MNQPSDHAALAAPSASASRRERRGLVLVADADAGMRDELARLLARDHEVIAAGDGEEALASARERRPDLVLTDAIMPRLDGFGLLAALRADRALSGVPVIMLSARAGEEARIEALEAGADDYLNKPFHARELAARINATIALAAARTEHIDVLENMTEGFVTLDAGWRIRYMNAAAEGINRRQRRQVLGRVLWEAFPATRGTIIEREYRKAMDERVVRKFESHYARLDRWHELVATPTRDGGLAVQGRDITERKRTEIALFESEARNRFLLALNHATQVLADPDEIMAVTARLLGAHLGADRVAYAEIEPDADHLTIGGNWTRGDTASLSGRRPLSMFGAEAARLMRAASIWLVNDLDVELCGEADRAACAGLQIKAAVCVPLHHTGRLVACMTVHQRAARAWTRGETELIETVADRCLETVERARNARRLAESEERFRTLADALPSIVFTAEDGWLTWINRFALEYFGVPREALLGDRRYALIHPEDGPRIRAEWAAALARGEGYEAQCRMRRADGAWRWVLSRALPVRDSAGRVIEWVGGTVDIDEMRRAQHALQDADRRKDEFLAVLAHELRNPLAPLRNALHILQIAPDPETARRVHPVMQRQIEHLVRLVDDLLEVSRIKRGKIELKRETLALDRVIASAVETSRPLIEAAGHQLDVVLPEEALLLDGDAVRLAQVFANLLNNAAKYTDAGGRIGISARCDDAHAVVAVEDNGVGIAAEMLPHVFDLFTQINRSETRSQGGLGIGLNLVKNLLAMHDGSVEAASAGPGRGSTFTVRLPLASGAAPGTGTDAFRRSGALNGPHRVLVVDDNRDAADSLGVLLEYLGASVEVVHDGEAALAACESFRPAFVLLDLGMPGMDGYEVARRLQARPGDAKPVLIAITGWGQERDRERTRAAGFDHHLVKPVDLDALQALLG